MGTIALLINRESGDGSAEMLRDAGADIASVDVRACEEAAGSGAERLVVG